MCGVDDVYQMWRFFSEVDGFSNYVEVLQKWRDLVIMWRSSEWMDLVIIWMFFRSGWI